MGFTPAEFTCAISAAARALSGEGIAVAPSDTLALAGWWALGIGLGSAVVFSAVSLLLRGPEDTLAVAHVRLLARCYMRVVHRQRVRLELDAVPREGPAIVVANHRSGVDPLAVGITTRRLIHFMMAREYYEVPVLRWFCSIVGAIPVNRDGHDLAATKAALGLLRAGRVVGVFPQGGIREGGEFDDAKGGVALLALKTGAVIVPCFIDGTPQNDSVLKALFTPSRTAVHCGSVLVPAKTAGKPSRDEVEELTQRIVDAIAAQRPVEPQPGPCAAG